MHSAIANDEFGLLSILSDGIIKAGYDWKIEYANPAAENLLGLGGTHPVGLSVWEILRGAPSGFETEASNAVLPVSCVFECPLTQLCLQVTITTIRGSWRVIQVRDVTPMTKVETALESNQRFLQAVLDNSQTGIVACDETGALKVFNNATRTFHGGTVETPLSANQWAEAYGLYHPDGETLLKKEELPLIRALSGEKVRNVEMVIAPRDGVRRSVVVSGHALTASDGRKLGAVIAMHDVTHRRVSTRQVRDALRQFRTLFHDAPIAYHEIDRLGMIRRVNRAESRLLGYRREALIGKPLWDFVPEDVRKWARASILEKLGGSRSLEPIECEYLTSTGKRVLVELHENHITDSSGAIVGIRTAMLDIQDRKRRQQEAQVLVDETAARRQAEAAEEELRSILERIGDAYIAFDVEWRYTYVNRKAAELARKPAAQLLGRSVWEEFPDAVHTSFFSELQRSMREQIPIDFINHFAPLGKWFENTVYPSPSGVSVFYRDITDRVRTHRALERRTAELARKNAELETFASVASHDLQEPLRMIGGYARLLERRHAPALDADGIEFLNFITQGVDRMQRLIRNLLALSRMGGPGDLQDICLAQMVERVCQNLDMVINETGAVIRHDGLPTVRFNETRITQVLQNLIGNALHYRGDLPPQITAAATREDGGWRIAITDNGRGFDMNQSENIFRPFKRLSPGNDGGSGIGLAICKKIVESRGGRIWAESVPGKGSTFYFTVPDTPQTGE